MKKLIALLLFVNLYSIELTDKQIEKLNLCYHIGKAENLENTLMGICYIESNLGMYKVGINDYGLAQINIFTHLRRINKKDTKLNRSYFATKLVQDDYYNLYWALQELLYWKTKKKNWYQYVSAYNRGHNGDFSYAYKVSKAIKQLKRYIKE